MPLQRRVPKRGFTNIFKKEYAIVNVKDLNVFENDSEITPEVLLETGMISKLLCGVKLLGDGELQKKLTIKVHKVSGQAEEKVKAQGGRVEVI